jgi:hypothetical protein
LAQQAELVLSHTFLLGEAKPLDLKFNGDMTRRRWISTVRLLVPLSGLARAWGATDFWNRKSAKDWDDEEMPVPELAQSEGGQDKPVMGARAATMTVCWDSAQPVLDALGNLLPAGLGGHYVLGVNDSGQQIEPLKVSSSLAAKGKEPVQVGAVVRGRDRVTVFFAFSKELLPLTVRDRDVLFSLDTDRVALKAKFDPKQMIYRGNLAL